MLQFQLYKLCKFYFLNQKLSLQTFFFLLTQLSIIKIIFLKNYIYQPSFCSIKWIFTLFEINKNIFK